MLLALIGFVLLAGGTFRQSRQWLGSRSTARLRLLLLIGGGAALAASLGLACRGPDAARAAVEWIGLLTIAALLVVIGNWALHGRE